MMPPGCATNLLMPPPQQRPPPAITQHQQSQPPSKAQSHSAESSGPGEQMGGNGAKRKRHDDGLIVGPDGVAPPLRDPKSGQTISLVSTSCHIRLQTLPLCAEAYRRCSVCQDTPEDIEKWRAERRKRWPSAANVAKKAAEQEQRRARGELPEAEAPRHGGRSGPGRGSGRGSGRGRGRGRSADRRDEPPQAPGGSDPCSADGSTAHPAAVGWAGMAERWGRGRGRDVRGEGRGRAARGRGANGRGRKPTGRGQADGPKDASAMQSRQPTLLRKLLRKEQRREHSLVLQLFRYLVKTDFFAQPIQNDRLLDDNINDEETEMQEGEVGPTGLSGLPPAAALIPAYQEMLAAVGVNDTDDTDDDDGDDDDSGDGNGLGLGDSPRIEEIPHGAASNDSETACIGGMATDSNTNPMQV